MLLLWSSQASTAPCLISCSPLSEASLKLCYKVGYTYGLPTVPTPSEFPLGLALPTLRGYFRKPWPVARNSVCPLTEKFCISTYPQSTRSINWLVHHHLDRFSNSVYVLHQIHRNLTPFEQLMTVTEALLHRISLVWDTTADSLIWGCSAIITWFPEVTPEVVVPFFLGRPLDHTALLDVIGYTPVF